MTAKEYNNGVGLWADDAMRFAMRCCPSRPDCEDAVQEALAALWSHHDEVPQAKGKSYLLSAAYRSLMMTLRHGKVVREHEERTVVDTLQEEPEFFPEPIPFSEPVAQAPKSDSDPLPERESVEPLPSLSLLESTELPEEVPPHTEYDSLAVSVDGNHLIIRGAEGEWIRVFDNKGWVVAAEIAGKVCVIDLSLYRTRRLNLRIGDRSAMRLKL